MLFRSDESEAPASSTLPKPKTAVPRAVHNDNPVPRHNTCRGNSFNLLSNLSQAFDPEAQRSRDAERASRSLHNTQFLTLSQQLRDAQQATESIRSQLADVQMRLQDAERARDRAEFRLEMVQMSGGNGSASISHHGTSCRHSVKQKHHCEEVYPEGGGKVWWVTDDEDINSDESRDTDGYRRPPVPHRLWSRPSTAHRQLPPTPYPRRKLPHCKYTPSPRPVAHMPSPFRSAMSSRNNTTICAPGLDLMGTDLNTHGEGPSSVQSTCSTDLATFRSLNIAGEAVELTVSPHRGPAVSFVISPAQHPAQNSSNAGQNCKEEDQLDA